MSTSKSPLHLTARAIRTSPGLSFFRGYSARGSAHWRFQGAGLVATWCCEWAQGILERKMFTRPFEGGDEHKWPYFLDENTFSEFVQALSTSPSAGCDVWGSEYDRVMEDLEILSSQGQVQRFEDIRLCRGCTTSPPLLRPLSLFSVTKGCDTGIYFSLSSFAN